jgi:hypothetical protein
MEDIHIVHNSILAPLQKLFDLDEQSNAASRGMGNPAHDPRVLRYLAGELGGQLSGDQIYCHSPGHSSGSPELSIKLIASTWRQLCNP